MNNTLYSIYITALLCAFSTSFKAYSQCSAPSVISASNIIHDSADIAWANVSNATAYEYAYLLVNTAPSSGTPNGISTVASLSSLTPGTRYYLFARAVCGTNVTSAWAVDSLTTLKECLPPDLKFTAVTQKSLVAYWDTVSGAIKYEYGISIAPSAPPVSGVKVSIGSVLVMGLYAETPYQVCVRTHCRVGYSPFVSDWTCDTITTRESTPSTPPCDSTQNIYFNVSGSDVTVSWDSVPGQMNYFYAWLKAPATIPPTAGALISYYPQTFKVQPGEKHYVCISTNCGASVSGWHCDSITIPLVVNPVSVSSGKISIYPNPATDVLNIDLSRVAADGRFSIVNTVGTVVYESIRTGRTFTIDVKGLATGVYFMKYIAGEESYVQRFVKQ